MCKDIWEKIRNNEQVVKEYDVTDCAIESIYSYYNYFGKNNYEFIKYQSRRRQMTGSGAYLKCNGKNGIDIVGDILTSSSFLEYKDVDKNVLNTYQKVHHTIGNIIPIPEGANYGSPKGKSDNYFYKLNLIKIWLENKKQIISPIDDDNIINLKERVKNSKNNKNNNTLGPRNFPNGNRIVMRYWLYKQRYYRTWQDYVEQNYLQDFVDGDLNIINKTENPKLEDIDWLIDAILKRGIRIVNKNELKENDLEEKLKEIKNNYIQSSKF